MDQFLRIDKEAIETGGSVLADAIATALNGRDYERGRLETIEASANSCAEVIGRLLLLFLEKGIVSSNDVHKIVEPRSAGFTEDGKYYSWPAHTERGGAK